MVGKFEPPKPMDFDQINKEDDGKIPQFLIDAENSVFAPRIGAGQRYANVPYNDIQAYFGVPDNAELAGYWETIEDRLFKIRHCMNIQGQVRPLARSEEHTSELQSLMRISYAVFCLQKQ